MATSTFFNPYGHANEQKLLHDLIEEAIKIHGVDMYYLPRRRPDLDDLYLEDDNTHFDTAYPIEIYVRDPYQFQGELSMMAKFGLEIRDAVTFTISKQVFENEISLKEDFSRPREGDLIYFTPNKRLFEIKFVEHKPLMYQFGTLPIYDCSVELFEYNQERFSTGIAEIDDVHEKLTLNLLDYGIKTENGLYITNEAGYYITREKNIEVVADPVADNETIQVESGDIIVFTEVDPFSEGNY